MGPLTKTGGGDESRPHPLRLVVSALCASAIAVGAGTAVAASGTHTLKSRLTSTASTIRAPHAAGAFTGTLRIAGKNSSFSGILTFRHLSGAAVRAGIYFGKTAKASQLAMLLCTACSSGAQSYYHGSYVAGQRFVRANMNGGAYVVLETKSNPKGEIRGRIQAKAP